jgi:type I restriction enzyme R subunit
VQQDNEPKRVALYKQVGAFLRAYANLANEMQQAGYTEAEAAEIKAEVEHFEQVREEVKLASGDYVDMKPYEPAMRHLLDSYIRAEDSEKLSAFDDMTLVEGVVERGEDALNRLPSSISGDREAMAETIENNVRRLIIDEMAVNPKYYERMSELLDALIEQRRKQALEYREYLQRIVELTRQAAQREAQTRYPTGIDTPARQALYDNLGQDTTLTLRLDEQIRSVKKADWRGNRFKEREVRQAIASVLETQVRETEIPNVETIFELVKHQSDY